MDYLAYRRAVLDGAKGIGKEVTPPVAERSMSLEQIKRRRGRNFVTDNILQYRRLAGGSLIVELSYGWMMGAPVFGLSVFCVAGLAKDAPAWDHSLSGAFHDVPSILGRLAQLESGGRERIAALAEPATSEG